MPRYGLLEHLIGHHSGLALACAVVVSSGVVNLLRHHPMALEHVHDRQCITERVCLAVADRLVPAHQISRVRIEEQQKRYLLLRTFAMVDPDQHHPAPDAQLVIERQYQRIAPARIEARRRDAVPSPITALGHLCGQGLADDLRKLVGG